jgi:hypothetical protein
MNEVIECCVKFIRVSEMAINSVDRASGNNNRWTGGREGCLFGGEKWDTMEFGGREGVGSAFWEE